MTMDVERDPNPSTLESFKFRWFKNDPDRYRLWWYERVTPLEPLVIDMVDVPGGTSPTFGLHRSCKATIPLVRCSTWVIWRLGRVRIHVCRRERRDGWSGDDHAKHDYGDHIFG